jgi:fatty acid desaturase
MNQQRLDRTRTILRANAAKLARRPWIYWTDLLGTAAIAWSALVVGWMAIARGHWATTATAFTVAVFAFYRLSAFLHEVAHTRNTMRGFDLAWNVVVGVPFLTPSFIYRGVHTIHHARAVFGTARDPEYTELDGLGHYRHAKLLVGPLLVPIGLLVRWLVLAPASLFSARWRRRVVEKHSSLAGNPSFVRAAPIGRDRVRWHRLEIACFIWSATLVALFATRLVPASCGLFLFALSVCGTALHGLRSFATHRFHGGGRPRTFEEQFKDSVNVTGDAWWTELCAPVGLRYHALHHFAPDLPYHALGAAHRLLLAELPPSDIYHSVTFRSFRQAFSNL